MKKYKRGTALKVAYGSGTQLAIVDYVDSGRIFAWRYRAASRAWTDPVAVHPLEVLGIWEGRWPRGAKRADLGLTD